MGYTEKTTQRTFDLKLNLHCKHCANDVKKIVRKIEGVDSIDIDKDLELGKATISGNVDPHTVIKKLKDRANKHAKLLGKEEERPPKINHQEMQIVLQQNPVRIDQRKVAPQPPDLELGKATISGNVDPQTVIKKLKRANKHAELLEKEEEERPPKINLQVTKSSKIQQNPVRIDQRKVAPQPSDLELGKATISGNVDPQTVIKKLKRANKHAELLEKEEEERPPKINHQVTKSSKIQQNPVRIDQRKVAPQPPGLISKSVGKRMERDIHDCNPKHDHELELKSYNKPFKCNRCREDGFTSGYRCKHCIYDLHKGCLNPKPEITHDLFPGSIFKFCQKPGKICDACGMKIDGHSYSCKEDNLDLHPACSKLPGKLRISGTDFVLCKMVKYKCFWCKKEKPSWLAKTKVAGLCYVSERDKFSCHVHCLSLVMQEAWKRGRGDLDRNDDDNDAISKALEKVDLKPVATAKGSGGEGGGLFLGTVTIFLKTIISILFGDPTGLIVFGLTELVKELLTL